MSDLYQIENLRLSLADMTRKPLLGAAPRLEIPKGLNFTIPKGEILGIVWRPGPSRVAPRGGARGPPPAPAPPQGADRARRALPRRFQMIFQDPMSSLTPRHRVGQIIAAPLSLHGLDNTHARALEALDHVGLPRSFARRFPHELSGGQRQRVGIARAIALKPDFILADEIVSGLDVSSQSQVLNLLEQLVKGLGLTLAFISHDLSVIRRLCTRVLVLHHGVIVENAATADVFAAPQAQYTRDLLDAIPLPDPDQVWV